MTIKGLPKNFKFIDIINQNKFPTDEITIQRISDGCYPTMIR